MTHTQDGQRIERPDMTALRARPLSVTDKGFGPLAARSEVSAMSLAARRPPLADAGLSYPLLTLRDSALEQNIAGMARFCAAAGVLLAPHGKTMMAPQLAARQLAAGAWAITTATIGQTQTYRSFGFRRLLLANELVDPAGIAWLAGQLAADDGFECYVYVDSVEGVRLLDDVLCAHPAGRRLPVLVELGHANGRTGARDAESALGVAASAAETETLSVAGVSGYEGGIAHHADPATLDLVARYCRSLRELAESLHTQGFCGSDPVLSAGGSAFFDIVTRELTASSSVVRPRVVLRSGAYLTHDHGFYSGISPANRHAAGSLTLVPALELVAPVLSRPEPALVLLGVGRRDVSFDEGLPVPLGVSRRDGSTSPCDGMSVQALNDQHAYLRVPPAALIGPGDVVRLGISHPCTTFDKWRAIAVLDDEDRVVDVVHTFF